jgi:uncharacterized membrane protein
MEIVLLLIYLAIPTLFGFWARKIAIRKNRGALFAWFMGFFFGLFAILVYALMDVKKIKK